MSIKRDILKVAPKSQEEINDENDVKKHVLGIHSEQIDQLLTKDFIMAKLNEKERTFISDNIEAAHEALHRIKYKVEAKYGATKLLLRALTVANLNRNVDQNHILKLVLNPPREQMEEPDRSLDEEMVEKLSKKEK